MNFAQVFLRCRDDSPSEPTAVHIKKEEKIEFGPCLMQWHPPITHLLLSRGDRTRQKGQADDCQGQDEDEADCCLHVVVAVVVV